VTSPNKRKGSTWERDLERFLAPLGAHRPRHQWGHEDSGDLHGLSPFVGQAKNYASVADALREGVAGAERQAVVAGEQFGVAFVKRRGKGAADGYAVMRIDTFARLLAHLRGL
jgi:hypothetical protein